MPRQLGTWISGLLGVGVCSFSFVGFSQMRAASLNGTASLTNLPVAKLFFDLFTPSTGTISAAQIASKAQFSLLAIGLIGLCLIALAVVGWFRGDTGQRP